MPILLRLFISAEISSIPFLVKAPFISFQMFFMVSSVRSYENIFRLIFVPTEVPVVEIINLGFDIINPM